MKILADKDIPYIHEVFGSTGQIQVCSGRSISAKDLKGIDALIVRSVTKVNSALLYDSSVKFIGTVTSGIDHLDQDYLKKRNIKYVSAAGSNAISVVEYVLAALFWLADRDHFFLRDKVVGIVGVGNIGSLLYKKLSHFGISTLLCDPYLSKKNTNKSWKSLEKLVSESDILTVHVPLTYVGNYPTWHMIHEDVLDVLPVNSTLINTSRGAVIDNVTLLKVLKNKKKINIILDVWESEPHLSLSLLSYVDLGTAHIAGHSIESKVRSIITVYDAYCSFFNFEKKVYSFQLFNGICNYLRVKKLDESIINKLIQIVYNIYFDHIKLNYFASKKGGFDMLRKYYLFRRELSSLLVHSDKDHNNEILMNLGFVIQ